MRVRPTTRLYLHFMDAYHYDRAQRNAHSWQAILQEARRALRIGLLHSDVCYVPASTFFESPVARDLIEEHQLSVATGRVILTSGDASLEEHREGKLKQYTDVSPLGIGYAYRKTRPSEVGYYQRPGSTRLHLEERWLERLRADNLLRDIDPNGHLEFDRRLELAWEAVPERLEGLAFVTGHAYGLLSRLARRDIRPLQPYVRNLIESSYAEFYTKELNAGLITELVRLRSPFPLPRRPESVSYSVCLRRIATMDLVDLFDVPNEATFLKNESALRAAVAFGRDIDSVGRSHAFDNAARKRYRPRVGLVTILEEEFRAVALMVDNYKRPPPSSGLLGAVDRLVAGADIGSVLLMRMNALRGRDKRFARPPAETDVLRGSDGKIMRDRGHSTSRLFRGVIASGNALVRDRTVRDKIGQVSGALAIEMEGAGVAEAAWSLGRQYLLVRGLTDYCDDNKSDAWHWYASGIAAATAVSILEYYVG